MKKITFGLAIAILLLVSACIGADYAALNTKAETQYNNYLTDGTTPKFTQEEYSLMIDYLEDSFKATKKFMEDDNTTMDDLDDFSKKYPYVSNFMHVLTITEEDQLDKKNLERIKKLSEI